MMNVLYTKRIFEAPLLIMFFDSNSVQCFYYVLILVIEKSKKKILKNRGSGIEKDSFKKIAFKDDYRGQTDFKKNSCIHILQSFLRKY